MDDGLYLRNTWVAEVDCGLTFRGNDLTKPDQRTASYSSTFSLPDTLAMRDLLAGGEQLDAGGTDRYQQLPAYLIENGEVIFRGAAVLTGFQGGWKLYLVDAVASFFDAIKDKSLSDLNLSRYDHTWDLAHRTGFAGASEGVVYPLIDYGGNEPGSVPYDTMTPALYVKTLFGEIVSQAGYTLAGDWLTDKRFVRMALPFVGDLPKNRTEEYQLDRLVRATTDTNGVYRLRSGRSRAEAPGSMVDSILPLNVTNRPGYQQSRKANYRADRYVYIASEDDRIRVQASITFEGYVAYGAPEFRLQAQRNGVTVEEAYWSEAGPLYFEGVSKSLNLDVYVYCKKGDELRVKIDGNSRTKISNYDIRFPISADLVWASYMPATELVEGQTWQTALNMPDLKQLDLLLGVAKLLCGTYQVDDIRRTVEFVPLQRVYDQRAAALDWSDRIEEFTEPTMETRLDGYGQRNYLYWKESSEKTDKRDKISKLGTGDGVILCDAPSYPAEAELFTLPFAAAGTSPVSIAGYGPPPLIRTRTLTPGNALTAASVQTQDAAPCLILMEPDKPITVKTKKLNEIGEIELKDVTLTGCWWGARPAGLVTADNDFTLSFPSLPQSGESGLIADYFGPLSSVLTLPALLKVSVCPDALDIATIDLSLPIRLQRVRSGSLDIQNFYGYLNELSPYRPGVPCTATLIKL